MVNIEVSYNYLIILLIFCIHLQKQLTKLILPYQFVLYSTYHALHSGALPMFGMQGKFCESVDKMETWQKTSGQ